MPEPETVISCWGCPCPECDTRLPPRRPAAYWWTFALSGNRVALCTECCAAFRANAEAEPSLGASRIQQIDDNA